MSKVFTLREVNDLEMSAVDNSIAMERRRIKDAIKSKAWIGRTLDEDVQNLIKIIDEEPLSVTYEEPLFGE